MSTMATAAFTVLHFSKFEPPSVNLRRDTIVSNSSSLNHLGLSLFSIKPSARHQSSNSIQCGSSSRLSDKVIDEPVRDESSQLEVKTGIWKWRGYSIRYQYSGSTGPAIVLIHGFGANSDHWRKNISALAHSSRVFSIDLIGYGYSDKPDPRDFGPQSFYTFETWATQLNEFCTHVVKDKAFFVCNSIGGVVGLQAAILDFELCRGIVILNISLRMLHIKKQPWFARPLIKSFQNLLRNTPLGKIFFRAVATQDSVRSILCQVLFCDIMDAKSLYYEAI